ncbi:MAG TPA: hypothetical protein VGD81_19830 [Opitutaceae bacterium]
MARGCDATFSPLVDFKSETVRGGDGCFRVGQSRSGQWWLVAPDGSPFFGCGIEGVRRIEGGPAVRGAVARLRGWHFNLLSAGSAVEFRGLGLPHLESLELRRAGDVLFRLGGAQLPDVFDPRWPAACVARVANVSATRDLIGLVTDAELGWAQPSAGGAEPRPSLLQICLSLDPRYAAYHAAWEFVLAPRGGELATLARAWRLVLPNRESLRQWTHEARAIATPGYLEDNARFTREFAQRYFRIAAAAVRDQLPGRLIFGAPCAVLPRGVRESLASWSDVDLATAPVSGAERPVFVMGFNWTASAATAVAAEPDSLSPLERMLRRGRSALEALVADPAVVGYSWSDYAQGDFLRDAPLSRGLLYENGWPAHQHVQPLASINARAEASRRAAVGRASV